MASRLAPMEDTGLGLHFPKHTGWGSPRIGAEYVNYCRLSISMVITYPLVGPMIILKAFWVGQLFLAEVVTGEGSVVWEICVGLHSVQHGREQPESLPGQTRGPQARILQ